MIFGVKENKAALGQFTSENCASCKNSSKYIFYRITKFIVIFFIKLIPISNRYESECLECEDIIKIDKKAGKKLAKQKFGVENSNQNFLIFVKLFFVAIVVAAAVVLPMILITPPLSPNMVKTLVDEPGSYTIVDKDDRTLAVVQVVDDQKKLTFYNDISDYKTPDGKMFELHKYYEEKQTEDGTQMAAKVDNIGTLIDDNRVNVQRYYYDIANGTYGFAIGVTDLSSIEYTNKKTVYPLSYVISANQTMTSTLVIFNESDWEIDARFEITEDGTEKLIDIQFMEKQDGRVVSETSYLPQAKDGSVIYLGSLSSASSGQEYYDFIMNTDLQISYKENYTYFENTNIIMNSTTTTTDENGNTNVSEEKYDIVKKSGYYILTDAS